MSPSLSGLPTTGRINRPLNGVPTALQPHHGPDTVPKTGRTAGTMTLLLASPLGCEPSQGRKLSPKATLLPEGTQVVEPRLQGCLEQREPERTRTGGQLACVTLSEAAVPSAPALAHKPMKWTSFFPKVRVLAPRTVRKTGTAGCEQKDTLSTTAQWRETGSASRLQPFKWLCDV